MIPARRRTLALGVLAILFSPPLAPAPAAAADYTLRLSSWGSPAVPQVAAFVPAFQQAVEEGSRGRIAVQSFDAGSLVKETEVASAIQSRVVDISLSTVGVWASISPPAALMNSIVFRPTDETFSKLAGNGSPLFQALDASLRQHGAVLLAMLDNGPPMVVSRDAIASPKDFAGKSIRVYDKASSEIVHTLGGAPSTLSVSDVYPAIQRGTVQAAIGGIQGVVGLKEYEIAKYLLDGNGVWGVGVTMYVMNAAALEELPPELRQVVLDAGKTAEATAGTALLAYFAKGLDTVREHGMQVTELRPGTPPYQAFADALEPLAKEQRARLPPELVKLVGDEPY
jgi:TRAP-type transport system periplasmic protein